MDGLLDLRREPAEVEGLAGADVQLREAARRSFSDGLGGQNWKRKLAIGKTSGEGVMMSAGWGQLTAGGEGGAGW